jgi:hypothetical protein
MAPKDISSAIDPSHIIQRSRQQNKDLPDISFVDHGKFIEINLTESVTITKAMNDQEHLSDWDNAMAAKFSSLDEKNTGILSPPPSANKIIGGMWLLTQKLNEFGEVVQHKAEWVVFGNHQEHMIHYFETYSSVAQNESLKMRA